MKVFGRRGLELTLRSTRPPASAGALGRSPATLQGENQEFETDALRALLNCRVMAKRKTLNILSEMI